MRTSCDHMLPHGAATRVIPHPTRAFLLPRRPALNGVPA